MSRELHIVGFKVGRETYGVPITSLHEIVRVPEITAVPDAPDYLEGVINLRGKIVSVMDLRKRFGEKQADAAKAESHPGGRTRGPAGWTDRGFGLRSTEDPCGRRGSSAGSVSGRRTELCDRTGQGRRTAGGAARHEQTAGSGEPAGQERDGRKEGCPEGRGAGRRGTVKAKLHGFKVARFQGSDFDARERWRTLKP